MWAHAHAAEDSGRNTRRVTHIRPNKFSLHHAVKQRLSLVQVAHHALAGQRTSFAISCSRAFASSSLSPGKGYSGLACAAPSSSGVCLDMGEYT